MDLSWFESLLYGLVSGLAEFLPISSRAHQQILLHLLGSDQRDPIRDFVVNVAMLLALFTACNSLLGQLRREVYHSSHQRRGRRYTSRALLDLKLIKNASIPLIVATLALSFFSNQTLAIVPFFICLLLNGVIIFASCRIVQGNKDARSMTAFDSYLLGTAAALSVFTGISRIAVTNSAAIIRGADKQHAITWALLLSIPALITFSGLDIIAAFTNPLGINIWSSLHLYLLSGIGAYIGGYLSVILIRLISKNVDFSGFAYYSWGAALFTFIIYLTVV